MKRRDFVLCGAVAGLLIPAAGAAGASRQQKSQAPGADEQQVLLARDNAWGRAEKEGDIAALEQLLDEHFMLVDFDGSTYSKAQYLDSLRKTRFDSYLISKQLVRHWGETGIVTGEWRAKWTFEDKQDQGTLRFTAVFARRQGVWLAVAESVVKLAG